MPKTTSSLKIETRKASNADLKAIPVSKMFDFEELTKDNENKIEIIAEIPVSTSKRDWDYCEEALKDVVKDVNNGNVVGFKGHQKAENLDTEFPDIKTIWLGAKYDSKNKKAIIRGLMDKHDEQLNHNVRNGIINTVSIYGQPTLVKEEGRIKVKGYKTLSIDWTPRNRAGMPTVVKVASGEMEVLNDTFTGELDGSFEETSQALNTAVKDYFGITDMNEKYAWGKKTFSDYAIYEISQNNKTTLHKVNYDKNNDTINIISQEEVKLVESYEPIVGEMNNKGGKAMPNNNNNETIKEIMPKDFKEVLGEMSAKDLKEIIDSHAILLKNEEKRLHGEMVKKCLTEKIENQEVLNLVSELSDFKGKTEELIKGEIDVLLNKNVVKKLLNTEYKTIENKNNDNQEKTIFKGLKRA